MERGSRATTGRLWLIRRGPEEAGPRIGAAGVGSTRRGGAPVREGGSGRVGELQEAEELPFWGVVRVEEGRRWGFIVGRISLAIMSGGGAPRRVWWLWELENVL